MSQLALEATRVQVDRWTEGRTEAFVDHVAEEVPVALVYNGISHAVMLASPSNLEDFGAGLCAADDHCAAVAERQLSVQRPPLVQRGRGLKTVRLRIVDVDGRGTRP